MIGGGLAGLVSAMLMSRNGIPVTVIEKRRYPFHRVCGEYISNETVPFLRSLGIYPSEFHPAQITRLQLSSVSGRSANVDLDLGGFGISRYTFDNFLYLKAKAAGVQFKLDNEVEQLTFTDDHFEIVAGGGRLFADVVVGAFGKRSKLDHNLGREFINRRSPYVGVKYHVRTEHHPALISLHNFSNGYCGISRVEEEKCNLCYLTHSDNLKTHGGIEAMQSEVMFRNPFIRSLFSNSDFLFSKPEVISEISFETKSPVDGHVLMTGDAAGMITPLCGNGMAMAIRSATLVSTYASRFCGGLISRSGMEKGYEGEWSSNFQRRLWAGRQVQNLFGSEWASNFAVNLARTSKPITQFIVSQTHGDPF